MLTETKRNVKTEKTKSKKQLKEISQEERLQLERLADIVLDFMFNNQNTER